MTKRKKTYLIVMFFKTLKLTLNYMLSLNFFTIRQLFLDDNNILYNFQSGFRKKFSTDTCLSLLNDKISKGFDVGLYTGMILIDLQKAFDTIDHEILLKKRFMLVFVNK